MGVIKLTKVAVRVWITSAGSHRGRTLRDRAGKPSGQPKRVGCVACGAAVTPAAVLAAMCADTLVEGCEARYFCPLLGSYVVGEYRLVSPHITRCRLFTRTALKCRKPTTSCATHTQEVSNSPTEPQPEKPKPRSTNEPHDTDRHDNAITNDELTNQAN